jgi:hypothetical protein
MKKISYSEYRFPPEIIQQAIWLLSPVYTEFSRRRRFIDGTRHHGPYEVWRWANHFGPMIAPDLRKRRAAGRTNLARPGRSTSFLESHADKLTADGDRRLVRHGHLPEREILSGFAKAAADEANRRKLRITGPKLAGRHALTKGG